MLGFCGKLSPRGDVMKKEKDISAGVSELRRRAEERHQSNTEKSSPPRSEEETQRLVHELQVHQIELEMQNEELLRVREELEAAFEKCTDLYDFAPAGYFTLDRDGFVRAANITAARLLGIDRSYIIGRRLWQFIDVRYLPFFSYFLRKVCTDNAKDSCELAFKRDGNSPLFVRIEAVSSSSADECRVAVIDITGQREAEDKLRRSEQQLAQAQEITHVGSWEWDSFADEISGSDEFTRIFGMHLSNYECFIELVHPDDREAVNEAVRETLVRQSPYDVQYRIVRPDGVTRVIHAMGKAISDDAGKLSGMMGTAQDVTEQKEAEEKLEILNAELAARAAELEAANIEMEAFNHMVAHDLRTPLNTISGYCQVLQTLCGGKLNKECNGYLKDTYDATMRMDHLIGTLLRFSSINRAELASERVDLSRSAMEVAKELEMSEPERRVAFRIAKGINVDGDANLLQIVLNNLIGNAWKYTSEKEDAVIELGVTEKEGKPSYFVRDNGPGFDLAYAEKLFIPFQRLPGAGNFKGHGIGLATVERIIRRHGGRVWADSKPGKGATFYFTVPKQITEQSSPQTLSMPVESRP
jgi:PAS domain S-box-containing protein